MKQMSASGVVAAVTLAAVSALAQGDADSTDGNDFLNSVVKLGVTPAKPDICDCRREGNAGVYRPRHEAQPDSCRQERGSAQEVMGFDFRNLCGDCCFTADMVQCALQNHLTNEAKLQMDYLNMCGWRWFYTLEYVR